MRWTIGRVAKIAGVTVRTLHHYDAIGLLTPSARSDAGYRQYTPADLDRLRQILFYRELEFSLDEIASMLSQAAEPLVHLTRQRDALQARIARLNALKAAVAREMEARNMGISLNAEERFEVFGDAHPEQYAEEAQERWGDSDAFKESTKRVSSYDKQTWLVIQAETKEIEQRFAALMRAGESAGSDSALQAAEDHRLMIDRWFYPCDRTMHQRLAEMYVADPRFAAHYDEIAPGLAQFVHDAIQTSR